MSTQSPARPAAAAGPGRLTLLEAEPGPARRRAVDAWLAAARRSGATAWRLPGDLREGGVMAAVKALLAAVVPEIAARAPDLLERHRLDLCLVLPTLRRELDPEQLNLTDTADEGERVRVYAADRANRSLHGVIDCLAAWHRLGDGAPWAIAGDDFDLADGLTHWFFAELLRRRGESMGIRFLLVTAPQGAAVPLQRFAAADRAAAARLALPSAGGEGAPPPDAGPEPADEDETLRSPGRLERRVRRDAIDREMYLPRLIHLWERSRRPARALRWQVEAIHVYNHRGLYEAAAAYAPAVEAGLPRLRRRNRNLYHKAVGALFFCYIPLGQVERAQRLLQDAIDTFDRSRVARSYYLMAMLHARFLPERDYDLAAAYLQQSLDLLPQVGLPDGERHFLTAFTMNGLAYVRLRQGRGAEAVRLCQEAIALLNAHLGPDEHRLHRSVLYYNIAQVYAVTGPYEAAVQYLSAALRMDPNYAEYYQERGSVYMKLERLEEAAQDYQRALRLSPAYLDVWTNLGQCYRAMERMEDAAAAYSVAIDLNPDVPLAHLGRAEANAALERWAEAIADYDAALRGEPDEPQVLAGRAVAHYGNGQPAAAVRDLDRAVALSPDAPELRFNRAVALSDLGRAAAAAADFRAYLRLAPEAEDREEIRRRLAALSAPGTAAPPRAPAPAPSLAAAGHEG